ncbi:MAG: septum formation initiator family protein [Bacteroidota bacterium]
MGCAVEEPTLLFLRRLFAFVMSGIVPNQSLANTLNKLYFYNVMDSLFYRRDKKSFDVKQKALTLLKNKRFMVRLVLGSILLLYFLFGTHGIIQRVRLQHQKSELVSKIQDAEAESKKLQAESKALDGDPKAIEKVAREKHGMIREGETVYKVNRK